MTLHKTTLVLALIGAAACARSATPEAEPSPMPTTDPRIGLSAGVQDAERAVDNLRVLATVPSPEAFEGSTNSDLAFTGNYAIQGNYNGFQVWDISTPSAPRLVKGFVCPASQSDVSVYKNLLFVSAEGRGARLDCGTQSVRERVSAERILGIRIFDISDIANPKYVGNVQTCRGSHTHTVVEDPNDRENIYVYVSGSAGIRPSEELPGCVADPNDPNTAEFRIEVIQVPLSNPGAARIVNSPRIFQGLADVTSHGPAVEDTIGAGERLRQAKARGAYTFMLNGREQVLNNNFSNYLLDSLVKARGGTGAPTGADSAKLRTEIQGILDRIIGTQNRTEGLPGITQCHDITVYPALGLAGGACEGYGLLLDISDVKNPRRIDAVADSNFAYWHSATFNNDGTKVLFSDEWGGGGGPKCRASDPKEWGADAIFTIRNRSDMQFRSYYKLPAPQTAQENCVAHNGSLIPIPGRDVMVQSWYQGGVSIFDWTDPANPFEIAFFDRGPMDATRLAGGGTWSAYWYNGAIYSSEMQRGFDVMELTPSEHLTQNEIDAAKTVRLDYFNAQGQPRFSWPPSFALARAYVDQLDRNDCMSAQRIASVRQTLSNAERAAGASRRDALLGLAGQIRGEAASSCDQPRMGKLADAVQALAGVQP